MATGNLRGALESFEQATLADRGNAVAWVDLATVQEALGDPKAALRSANRALQIAPDFPPALVLKAIGLSRLGKIPQALEILNQALAVAPGNETAWLNKGVLLARDDRIEEAARCYAKAIEIDDGYSLAWMNLGSALFALGKHAEASECYGNVTRLRPEAAEPWFFRARARLAANDRQGAQADVARALALRQDFPEALRLSAALGGSA